MNIKTLKALAPAKINLSLDITGKKDDGYHLLRTVMHSVSVYDEITITQTDSGKISLKCSDGTIPCDERNLCVKAAAVFFAYTGSPLDGIEIVLMKKIPHEAGLGGGSSDAAAVLLLLNKLYGEKLSLKELCNVGLKIGADIPFCLYGGCALCEGTGEIITRLKEMPRCSIVISKPQQGISTVEAYKKYDKIFTMKKPETDDLVAAIAAAELAEIAARCVNVLEEAADCAEVTKIKEKMLECGALCSVMSGSGSAVYGLFDKKFDAVCCAEKMKKLSVYTEVCSPCSGIMY